MNRSVRSLTAIILALVALAAAVPLAVARAADVSPASTGDDNVVVALNVEDGTTVFEFSLSLRRVANGTVDQTNVAAALASCTDCTTVALAFQGVLVTRNADMVVPHNVAFTYNDQCVRCFSYASATQLVFGFDGPVRVSPDGRHRLNDVRRALRTVQDHAAELTAFQLVAFVEAVEAELFAILTEETIEVGRGRVRPTGSTTAPTTTTTPESERGATGSGDLGTDEPTASSVPGETASTSLAPTAAKPTSPIADESAAAATATTTTTTTVPDTTPGSTDGTSTLTPETTAAQPRAPVSESVESSTATTIAPAPSEPPSTESP